jgi:hypothetical protein
MTTSTLSAYYRLKWFCSTSARCNVRPRAQILIIPPASFADNPFTLSTFEIIQVILAFKRAEDNKLMKFQRATEFTRVPPDLTTLLYTNTWFSVCFHCIVTFKPKVILPDDSYVLGEYAGSGSLKGKPAMVRDTHGIVTNFVRALEQGYRSENGLSVRMFKPMWFVNLWVTLIMNYMYDEFNYWAWFKVYPSYRW